MILRDQHSRDEREATIPASMKLRAPGWVKTVFQTEWPGSVWSDIVISQIVGFFYALLLFGRRGLNPHNISWIHGDPATYYIGWTLFRQDWHFHWPLAYTTRIGYPLGDSIALMDVNPLIAVLLKPLSPLLPHNFQYFGLESSLAAGLQFFFALRLFRLLLGSNMLAVVLPSIYFLIAPVMTLRFGWHYALTNQWVLTAALLMFCIVYTSQSAIATRRIVFAILALGGISVAINPYLAFQVVCLLVATIIAMGCRRLLTVLGTTTVVSALAITCASMAYAFGFVIPGGKGYVAGGYRNYSMNLLAPFDPGGYGALFTRPLPLFYHEQYEGYCYLGAGVILLAAFVVLTALVRRPKLPRLQWSIAIPLIVCCCVLTLMALSTEITIGPKWFVDLDPQQRLTPYMSLLRSSGRLFWAPYYVILTMVLTLPYLFFKKHWASTVLAVALVIQIADTAPLRKAVYTGVNGPTHLVSLKSAVWHKLGLRYKTLMVMPPWQCRGDASPWGKDGADIFGLLAAEQDMRTNSYRSGRLTEVQLQFHCGTSLATFGQENLSKDSVYVVQPESAFLITSQGRGKCHTLDGFILCSADDDFGLKPVTHWETMSELWVQDCFKTMLRRNPTDAELAKWSSLLDHHTIPPEQIVATIVSSPEFERNVLPVFWAYLDSEGRWPSRAEWLETAVPDRSGASKLQIQLHDRNLAILHVLYFSLLKRDPDPGGISEWAKDMKKSISVQDVAWGIMNSPEYKAQDRNF